PRLLLRAEGAWAGRRLRHLGQRRGRGRTCELSRAHHPLRRHQPRRDAREGALRARPHGATHGGLRQDLARRDGGAALYRLRSASLDGRRDRAPRRGRARPHLAFRAPAGRRPRLRDGLPRGDGGAPRQRVGAVPNTGYAGRRRTLAVGDPMATEARSSRLSGSSLRRHRPLLLGAAAAIGCAALTACAGGGAGCAGCVALQTRPGVTETFQFVAAPNPSASVVLFVGGDGVVADVQVNFLLRVRGRFVEQDISVAVFDAPSDQSSMSTAYRTGDAQAQDVAAVVRYLKS